MTIFPSMAHRRKFEFIFGMVWSGFIFGLDSSRFTFSLDFSIFIFGLDAIEFIFGVVSSGFIFGLNSRGFIFWCGLESIFFCCVGTWKKILIICPLTPLLSCRLTDMAPPGTAMWAWVSWNCHHLATCPSSPSAALRGGVYLFFIGTLFFAIAVFSS